MSEERPTFSDIGEENVRQMLRRRCDERALYGAEGRRFAAGVRALVDGVE